MKRFYKKLFKQKWFNALGISLSVGLVFAFVKLSFCFFGYFLNMTAFNQIETALEDIRFSDLIMRNESRLEELTQDGCLPADQAITLIHCNGKRKEIAQIINVVNTYQSKVIGLDYTFDSESAFSQDTIGTDDLKRALNNSKCWTVIPSEINIKEGLTGSITNKKVVHGNSLVLQEGNISTVRYFKPVAQGDTAFGVMCANYYLGHNQMDFFKKYSNESMIINFIDNSQRTRFEYLDWDDVDDYDSIDMVHSLKNKIVLIGLNSKFKHDNYKSIGDMYYTPLNESFIGRSKPDTYGVEIHAQIIAMLLNKNFLVRNQFLTNILSFVILFLTMYLIEITVEFFQTRLSKCSKDERILSILHELPLIFLVLLATIVRIMIALLFFICISMPLFRCGYDIEINFLLLLLAFSVEGYSWWELIKSISTKNIKKHEQV